MQGHAAPLKLVRDTCVRAAVPAPVDGIWLGKRTLRIQLIVKTDEAGRQYAPRAFDSQFTGDVTSSQLSIRSTEEADWLLALVCSIRFVAAPAIG
jgi:hypothetical protein